MALKQHDKTVQETLNVTNRFDPVDLQTVVTGRMQGGVMSVDDPWHSIRCFNMGNTTATNWDGYFDSELQGGAVGSGSLGPAVQNIFTSMSCRVDKAAGYPCAAATVEVEADELDFSSFPTSGTLYIMSYDTNSKPVPQIVTYTGKTGTKFTGISGWIETNTPTLLDDYVITLYKDANGLFPKPPPIKIDVYVPGTTIDIELKFNDPDAPVMHIPGGEKFTLNGIDQTRIDDIFFAASVNGEGTYTTTEKNIVFTAYY